MPIHSCSSVYYLIWQWTKNNNDIDSDGNKQLKMRILHTMQNIKNEIYICKESNFLLVETQRFYKGIVYSGKRIYTFPEYANLEIWDHAHKCLHISLSPYSVPYLWLSLNWTLAKVVTALANVVPVLASRSALAFMSPQQGQILPKIFSR